MNNQIRFLADLIKSLCEINFAIIENTEATISDYFHESTNYALAQTINNNFIGKTVMPAMCPGIICEFYIAGGPYYTAFLEQGSNQIYVLGPILTDEYNRDSTIRQLADHGIELYAIQRFMDAVHTMPVLPQQNLLKAMHILSQHISGQTTPCTTKRIQYLMKSQNHMTYRLTENNEDVSHMRQIETRYETSTALTEAVKEGNVSLAIYLLSKFNFDNHRTMRNANPLRNLQNYCIILNTQLRYALEERGIHPYLLDAFSSDIAQRIEQLKSVEEGNSFAVNVIRSYCKFVQEQSFPNLKPLIHLAVTYIKEHLNDNLTVKDTAKALTMNANYLSTQFHKEMGISFIDFVNQERIKQASSLLQHTNLPIKDIASFVGYNNTSYFSKQFAKVYHQAPTAYRSSRYAE